ncbi:hypothetical protein DPMN_169401, partial [Dreissena polymorpha]
MNKRGNMEKLVPMLLVCSVFIIESKTLQSNLKKYGTVHTKDELLAKNHSGHYQETSSLSSQISPENWYESSPVFFQQTHYVGLISENEPIGSRVSVIGQLSVANCVHVKYKLLGNDATNFELDTRNFISTHNNILLSRKSFDREDKSRYHLIVQAECAEQDGVSHTVTALVDIYILDINDNVPAFHNSFISVQTASDQSWNAIASVQASDEDENEIIAYSIEDNPDFYIDQNSGELLAESDYLYPGSYSVSVTAVDSAGHRSKPLNVRIEVPSKVLKFEPVHNHHVSKRAITTISKKYPILENNTQSLFLFSVATSQPRSFAERYSLVSSSVDIILPPDKEGNVYLVPGRRLDYENVTHRVINMVFNITNQNTPEDFTLCNVTIEVQDKNDERPVFKNVPFPFLATVSSSPGFGENVYTLYAHDPDNNNRILYNLESGGEGKFEILTEEDYSSGEMVGKIVTTVSGPGQFVSGAEYTLVVSAQDMAAGLSPAQKSEFAVVKVLVGLRPPQLFENPFVAKVDENSGTGYRILGPDNRILQIRAKLFQDTVSNLTEFSLTDEQGKLSSLFSINRQGNIETLQNLDYEELPNQYRLNVTVTELETKLSSTAQLVVNVVDSNDNSPKFELSTYTASVQEDIAVGAAITMREEVIATDRDSGLNGEIEYFVSDPHFSIKTMFVNNRYVGRISVARPLDYDNDTSHQYTFKVTARDKGEIRQSGVATVIVYVTNVNDEAPVFGTGSEHRYTSISEEQTIGTVVTIVQATDPDGDNIQYYFKPRKTDSYPFQIDPTSGLIKLIGSLPDSIPYYTLNITAYDDGSCCGGSPVLSSDSYIVVEVKDTNNNQPQFPSCTYAPQVLENQDIGTAVVQVSAVDNDRGSNGNITYSIVRTPRQQEQFAVDPVNGRVVTAVQFDRESIPGNGIVPVTVKAADQGLPQSLESHCTFWVTIGDMNDNSPKFDSPSYSTSLSESSATVGRRVFAVRASDADHEQNANIVYSLVDNPGNFCRIEPDTGIIYVQKMISGKDTVVLRVKAEDQGTPKLSAFVTVTISITDRNSNPPTWDSNTYEREYEVKETAPIAYVITSMTAQSNTPAPLDGVSFGLIDEFENTVQQLGPFRIQQQGNRVTLMLRGVLDFNVKNRYELRLRVTNQGQNPLSAEIRPVIVVKDMNNEPPQFEGLDMTQSNSYKGTVPENELPGQTVIQIKAVDPDHDPPNNVVRYSLMPDSNDAYMHFNIDEVTGVITTRSQFDREQQAVYYIKVKAEDGKASDAPGHFPENTPNSATASVQIMISDKNDNAPFFLESSYKVTVPERQPDSNSPILTVVARDKDDADQLMYRITEGNINNVFGIKQKTGDIYVAKMLDYETPPTEYRLRVIVQDGRYENSTEVVVTVTDVNDNPPE